MADRPNTPLLDKVNKPEDLKQFSDTQLRQLADELRTETISAVSETGGHLGAGLGVVELTTAIHAVFHAPKDRLIRRIVTRIAMNIFMLIATFWLSGVGSQAWRLRCKQVNRVQKSFCLNNMRTLAGARQRMVL